MVVLQKPLRVRERPVLLSVRGAREEEHLGLDVLRPDLAPGDLRSVAPELCRLGGREVPDHQPVQLAKALAVQRSVHRADGRVLSHQEVALDLPVSRRYRCREVSVLAFGMGMYPGRRSYRVGTSVDPWIDAWPRNARIPPPGRPMFPRSSWMIAAARMYCTPTECWVQPTA